MFQRGLLSRVDAGRGTWLAEGSGVAADELGMVDRREVCLLEYADVGAGSEECLLLLDWGAPGDLPLLGTGVCGSKPRLVMITDDGGELPGVSWPLPTVERSLDSKLETESLSCRLLLSAKTSSTMASVSDMLALRLDHLDCRSECSRKTSPLTVRRSLTPRSMMDRTRSIAGP